MNKKFLWLILALTAAAALFFIGRNVLADPAAGNPFFSGEPDTNIGAWYDETWQASGFYNLEQPTPGNFRYAPVPNNDPIALPPFDPGAPDIVVTEWSVTGHVHFSSSGL